MLVGQECVWRLVSTTICSRLADRPGVGNPFLSHANYIVECRWRAAKIINCISKFYLCLPKENKERNIWEARDASPDSLCKYLLVTEYGFDAMLCSILGKENSDAGHIH